MAFGRRERSETEIGVEAVGVLGDEVLAADILELGMRGDEGEGGFGQAAAAVRCEHVDIAEVRESRGVGDDADKADLRAVGSVDAEAE